MTRPTDPLFDQRIADWLEDDPVEAPGQVLDIVLAAFPSIPRRRAFGARWRLNRMPGNIRWPAAAAAATVVVLVGGALYLNRPSQPAVGAPSATPGVSSSPSPFASPTAVTTRAPSWTATRSMGAPRAGQSATLLPDGRVLVLGGEPNGPEPPSAEVYDPTTGSWTAAGRMLGFSGTSLTLLLDGRVLAGTSELGTAELYDPGTGAWTATGRRVAAHVDGETTTRLSDGRVLVAGGHADTPNGVTGSAELYDPQTGRWTVTGSMVTPRAGHTATLLPDGRVLVAGGGDYGDDWIMASAELYDPVSGTWTATGTMLAKVGPRNSSSNQVATLLRDGRVLVAGFVVVDCVIDGSGPCSFVSDVELYDPGSGTWTATGTMADAREGFTATLLPDGTVLVAGGVRLVSGSISDPALASAELYDPGTGTWTVAATMAVPRVDHTATLLLDGKVLVAGGVSDTDLASAELYDPGSGTR